MSARARLLLELWRCMLLVDVVLDDGDRVVVVVVVTIQDARAASAPITGR
jgi:hypothetical protein